MSRRTNVLFAGTGRHVVALRADNGTELWRTKLPSSVGQIVSVLPDGPRVYVGHAGKVYALSAGTGEILWENGLPRTGFGAVLMALPGGATTMDAAAAAQAAAEAAAAQSAAT